MKKLLLCLLLLAPSFMAFSQWSENFMQWGDSTRRYLTYVPGSYNESTPAGVMFVLHGLGGVPDEYMDVSSIADQSGWIIVAPQALGCSVFGYGLGNTWNVDMTLSMSGMTASLNADVDDVGWLMAVLDSVEERYTIDADSVFFMGFSMGAFMSHRMAIEHGDRINAIATMSGLITTANASKVPTGSPRVIHFHGTSDNVVSYSTGGVLMPTLVAGLNAEQTVAWWAEKDGCIAEPQYLYYDNLVDDGLTFERFNYFDSNNEPVVAFVKINGGEHDWYDVGYDISCTREAYNFFVGCPSEHLSENPPADDNPSSGIVAASESVVAAYPNPATQVLNISQQGEASVSLINAIGKTVMQASITDEASLNVANLPRGTYIMQVRESDSISTIRIILL